jgi:hypothetical protein
LLVAEAMRVDVLRIHLSQADVTIALALDQVTKSPCRQLALPGLRSCQISGSDKESDNDRRRAVSGSSRHPG